jgi:hypothetical protein
MASGSLGIKKTWFFSSEKVIERIVVVGFGLGIAFSLKKVSR